MHAFMHFWKSAILSLHFGQNELKFPTLERCKSNGKNSLKRTAKERATCPPDNQMQVCE